MNQTSFSHRCARLMAGGCCLALLAALPLHSGCATTSYTPTLVARGEITLRYENRFALVAGQKPLSHGLLYKGLPEYVRCVPEAARHAQQAQQSGRGAIALSVLGAVLGVGGLGGLYGLYDRDNLLPWLAGGVGLGIVGATLAGLSYRLKNHANGHALDAVNYYNDAVGSLGATCDDLRYPEPAGPAPGGPLAPSIPAPGSPPSMVPGDQLPPPPLAPADPADKPAL